MRFIFITDDISLKIYCEGQKIEIINPEKVNTEILTNYEAVILDTGNIQIAKNVLREIRESEKEEVALKPVLIFDPQEMADEEIISVSDGKVIPGKIEEIIPLTENILKLYSKLSEFKTENYETNIMVRILRFLYTRQKKLSPVISTFSKFGYFYPIVAYQFQEIQDFRVYEILARMESENLLSGTFLDRIHFCNKCHSGFMNFREICPNCRSSYLKVEDLIHHFPCGAVYPQSKFLVGEQLICPKCNKILRHIGMDYEKPSSIFECRSCGATFQEPSVEVFCLYCRSKFPVEESIIWDIKIYELTPGGENCAIHGLRFSIADLLKDKLEFVEYGLFKKFISLEKERKKRYGNESSIGSFQIKNFQDIYILIGERKNELAIEIAEIIKGILRKSDLISVLNESTFLILLTETPPEKAKIALERVKTEIDNVLKNNLTFQGKEFIPQISINVAPVDNFSLNTIF